MKRYTRNRLVGALCAGALLTMSFGATAATQTASGVTVSNSAKVDYKVGGVPQPTKTSNTETFVVDAKLSLTVTKADATITPVSPGQSTVVLKYTVTNNGNDAQGALLAAFNAQTGVTSPFGTGTDSFDVSNFAVAADNPGSGTVGSKDAADTATSVNSIAANGGTATVFVTFDVPTSAADAAIAAVALQAQVATSNATYGGAVTAQAATPTATAWSKTVVQYVFADTAAATAVTGMTDAANDGYASDLNAVKVASATIAIAKTVEVVSDPTGSATPRAIPGAVMKYTITVTNSGGTAATGVSVSDDLDAEITAGHIAYKSPSLTATANGTAIACTEVADTDGCKWDSATGVNTVTVDNMTVNASKTAVVTFEVTIQ